MTLFVKGKDGTEHSARALSDGTLRFLALAVLEIDPAGEGVICLEEPENGLHPDRIPAMLQLLQDIATDPSLAVDDDNPLRQVIINTHSPVAVSEVPDDSLLIAGLKNSGAPGGRFSHLSLACLPGNWRENEGVDGDRCETVARGRLLSYLNPTLRREPEADVNGHQPDRSRLKPPERVVDREDVKKMLRLSSEPNE